MVLIYIHFVFCPFRVTPTTYGGSQARGPIGAVTAGLRQSHSNTNPRYSGKLHHSSWQCWILNPLSKARDWTHNLMVPSWICFHCAMTGTLVFVFFNFYFNIISKGYFLFAVTTKLWLYSLCCTIHSWTYVTPNSLYLPFPYPILPFPHVYGVR